jgi:hypothetical protein
MKQSFFAFFLIALIAELTTSLLQKFQGARELAEGIFYPSLATMVMNRLIVWLILYLLLSALWLLISRGYRRS